MAQRSIPGSRAALTIAASDSAGGSGLQADLKTFAVLDVYGAAVVTAIAAQNSRTVKHWQVLEPQVVVDQIDVVGSDLAMAACKTGALGNAKVVEQVAKAIARNQLLPLVVDPVLHAHSGESLLDEPGIEALRRKLLPLAALATPNLDAAARLLGVGPIQDGFAAGEAARAICHQFGARACVVTGLRRPAGEEGQAVDYFFDGKELHELVSEWRLNQGLYGAGCTFSAAITAALALGQEPLAACQTAKAVVSEAIRQGTDLGGGVHPVNHLAYLKVKK